ncbi:CarD family transcriptional regulator [uncultured Acetatifactor sp.]|uniref:CarD family transcriptional regulator n=1 Tax=uncultured Acetatifactor sp. TaxID=1671927 RepID=UPI0025D71DFC|nr:CarD family transcriptional regulator [uncultured Acetatifactor sp.]MCI8697079.1 CarD family transcriptional regulator [Lachnospiraceae bacterium]MCI9229693.1 CarD family transcriptional regulator [Lachnospiraceae bacterium]MCI9652002.1 CarD family transcriptional regulator [Lachnospiraceae bacterium]
MFQIGDYVICSNKGVCEVENITVLNISGADKEKEYYILKPLYSAGSTVYVPVDSQKDHTMRKVLERTEAERLIGTIPEIPLLVITNDKMTEQMYKDCMKSNDCQELVKLIKTIHQRKQKRIQAGRKITAVDAKYFHLAEENLYGELAVALDLSREEVSGYITAAINGTKAL